jgi:hypothetical protein
MHARLRFVFAPILLFLATVTVSAADLAPPPSLKKPVKVADAQVWKPGTMPDRVILCMTDDPAHRMAVTWRTSLENQAAIAQFAVAEAGPKFTSRLRTVVARSTTLKSNNGLALYHEATLDELMPDSSYVYRVGDGVNFTEWYQFRTASNGREPFTFIYFGDAQNDLKQHWSRVIRQSQSDAPKARFFLHAGDLVNSGAADSEWGEWCHAGGFLHAQIACVATPGNHEYSGAPRPKLADVVKDPIGTLTAQRKSNLTAHWRAMFSFPENGPAGLEESAYWFDYQGARFVSLNSNVEQEKQAEWLEHVLADNPNRWTILTFHHPIFSTAKGRDNKKLRETWQPVFDRCHIDLVLQGHDHTYGRSGMLETNLPAGLQVTDSDHGTVYVVSVSGPKSYTVEDHPWMHEHGTGRQLYQIITIDGDTLHYESRTAAGELYDIFELRKQSDRSNILVEKSQIDAEARRWGGLTRNQTLWVVGGLSLLVLSIAGVKAIRRGTPIV